MKTMTKYLVLMMCWTMAAHAQTTEINISDTTNTLKLQRLLDSREQLFYQYSYQIQTKTGIFGNQTTKDLTAANGILLQVVAADNKIINQLDAVIKEQRYIDRTQENKYMDTEQRLVEYGKLTDKLKAENDQATQNNLHKLEMQQRWTYFALAAAVVFAVLWVVGLLNRRG
jgi:lipopolysaccharide export LptBFGC system permease protein LptF